MTSNLPSNSRRRGASVCGLGGLALASVLLLCGAGNVPVENFTPQGPMQADLNAGGHNVTNAAAISATNVAAGSLTASNVTVGALSATNVTVSGSLTATNFTLPFASVTAKPTTLAGYGVTDAYTQTAADARYSPMAGSTNLTTLGAITAGSFPYAKLTGNPVTLGAGKTFAVNNTLTLAGTDGSTLNVGAGGTLGSAAFAATSAFLAPSAIGATVQGYNAGTTTLGNAVNGAGNLVQTDGNGLLLDVVLRPGAKVIYVSQGKGSDTRTALSKYSTATPFATLTAAAGAAAAGDTIMAEDGVFTDKNLVLVTGVNWLFLPGATVAVTAAGNGDAIFKDNGTAATAVISGYGQTFSISGSTTSTNISLLAVTAASNLTVNNLYLTASESGSFGSASAVLSNSTSAVITINGSVNASATGLAYSYGINVGAAGGGTIIVNGNASAATTGLTAAAIYCGSATTSSGSVFVSGRVSSNASAILGSSACSITCGSLVDGTAGCSTIYNHLTLLGPFLLTFSEVALTGFTVSDTMGPQDHLFEITPAGTLASGTVNLPLDLSSRIGERVTVMSTQTITSLTIAVPGSGTLYGYSPTSVGPGSISFLKISANTWLKL
jgi:hypothetical protein